MTLLLCLRAALLFSLLGLVSGCGHVPGGTSFAGIDNFRKVNDALYRGGQPDAEGIQSLSRIGVKTIINLRQPYEVWDGEAAAAQAAGIGYLHFPLNNFWAPPDAQMAAVLASIRNSPAPVFVHCRRGAERTGTVIACYRIEHDGWTSADALREATEAGMSPFVFDMRRFVSELKQARQNAPR